MLGVSGGMKLDTSRKKQHAVGTNRSPGQRSRMVTSLTCENGRRKKKQEQEQEQEHEQEVAMHGPRPAKVVGGVGAMRSR